MASRRFSGQRHHWSPLQSRRWKMSGANCDRVEDISRGGYLRQVQGSTLATCFSPLSLIYADYFGQILKIDFSLTENAMIVIQN